MKSRFLVPVARAGVCALCLAFTLGAHAQQGGGMGRMGRGPRAEGDSGAGAQAAAQPAPLQDRLYQARMHLLIDKDQGPAWERFYSAEIALQQGPGPGAPDTSMTAPQAMQLARTAAESRYARTEELAEALKVLYLQLDDNQRRAADEVLPPLLMQYAAGPRGPRGAAER